ncbi:MAG: TonB-dependent receptor, partial [Chitinophagaceae bacterium]|nr:TonB-dependent receptor [Chitinophagaceae bacterium]
MVWEYNGIDLGNANGNPLAYLKQKYQIQTYNLLSNLQIRYQLAKGLVARAGLGYNSLDAQESSISPKNSLNPTQNPKSSANFGTNNYKTWIIEPQLQYTRQILQGRLDALFGTTFQQNNNTSLSLTGTDYSNDALLNSILAAATKTINSDGYSLYKYNAVFARLNYILLNKYIINLTGRRDGSSRFGPGKQFGSFGSVGAGWIFTEEPMIKRALPYLSYGKIRVSYGTTGNDNIGNYQYIPNWSPMAVSYQQIGGLNPVNLYQPNFGWSVTKKFELGFEFGLFKDRIVGNVLWYQNRCGNQLVAFTLPNQTGFNSVTANFPAIVQNKGWEIQLNTMNIKSRQLSWNTTVVLTIPDNKLVSYPDIKNSPYSRTYVEGQSLQVLNKFIYSGVNPTTGIFEFASKSEQPPVDFDDYHVIGNLDPKYFGGIRNLLTFKGLQIDIFFEYRKQLGSNYLRQIYSGNIPGTQSINQPAIIFNRWQTNGDVADIQRYTTLFSGDAYNAARNFSNSAGAYTDASFIRLKTLSLGYQFNE